MKHNFLIILSCTIGGQNIQSEIPDTDNTDKIEDSSENNKFELISNAFENNGKIPEKFTCDGQNISPSLSWSGTPPSTKSFVLIVDDPDAVQVVGKTFIHWNLVNLPSNIDKLPENMSIDKYPSAKILKNSSGKEKYMGPCPPAGQNHRYFFTLFAMDDIHKYQVSLTAEEFKQKMKEHILGEAVLIGTYQRKK